MDLKPAFFGTAVAVALIAVDCQQDRRHDEYGRFAIPDMPWVRRLFLCFHECRRTDA